MGTSTASRRPIVLLSSSLLATTFRAHSHSEARCSAAGHRRFLHAPRTKSHYRARHALGLIDVMQVDGLGLQPLAVPHHAVILHTNCNRTGCNSCCRRRTSDMREPNGVQCSIDGASGLIHLNRSIWQHFNSRLLLGCSVVPPRPAPPAAAASPAAPDGACVCSRVVATLAPSTTMGRAHCDKTRGSDGAHRTIVCLQHLCAATATRQPGC
jgi:hypothetical protein